MPCWKGASCCISNSLPAGILHFRLHTGMENGTFTLCWVFASLSVSSVGLIFLKFLTFRKRNKLLYLRAVVHAVL